MKLTMDVYRDIPEPYRSELYQGDIRLDYIEEFIAENGWVATIQACTECLADLDRFISNMESNEAPRRLTGPIVPVEPSTMSELNKCLQSLMKSSFPYPCMHGFAFPFDLFCWHLSIGRGAEVAEMYAAVLEFLKLYRKTLVALLSASELIAKN